MWSITGRIPLSSAGVGSYYDGKMSLFRVRNQVLTQADVDKGMAVRYTKPAYFADLNFKLDAKVRKGGETDLEREYKLIEVARDSTYIYTMGGILNGLDATDELRIGGIR